MAKISELASGGVVLDTDEMIALRAGGNVRVTVGDLATQDTSAVAITGGDITGLNSLGVTGEITANGGITLGDNDKATFGTGDDLEIYHDGSHSYIKDVGTGNLKIQGANVEILTAGGTKYADFAANVSRLYHTGNAKLSTSTSGITVTGLDVGGTTTGSGYLYLSSKTANQGLRLNNTTKIQSWNPAGTVLRDLMELDANEDVRIGSSANDIYLDNDTTVTGVLTVTGNIEASERIRLGNNKLLQARNEADTQWRPVLKVDTNNDLVIGSSSTPITLDVDTTVTGGLRASGYQATPLTNEGLYGGHPSRGAYIQGHGSANDFTVANQTGTIALAVPQNTINVEARGDLSISGLLNLPSAGDLTLSSGTITVTGSSHRIDTQGSTATDTLQWINGGVDGDIIILSTVSGARDIVIRGEGNIIVPGISITLNGAYDTVMFRYSGPQVKWLIVSFNDDT